MKWDVKVYDEGGEEQETIRGLTLAQQTALFRTFEREGIAAVAKKYPDGGTDELERREVNMGHD